MGFEFGNAAMQMVWGQMGCRIVIRTSWCPARAATSASVTPAWTSLLINVWRRVYTQISCTPLDLAARCNAQLTWLQV